MQRVSGRKPGLSSETASRTASTMPSVTRRSRAMRLTDWGVFRAARILKYSQVVTETVACIQ